MSTGNASTGNTSMGNKRSEAQNLPFEPLTLIKQH